PRFSNLLRIDYQGLVIEMPYRFGRGAQTRDFLRERRFPLVWNGIDQTTGAIAAPVGGAIERQVRKTSIWLAVGIGSFVISGLSVLANETLHVGDWVGVPILGGLLFGTIAILVAKFS